MVLAYTQVRWARVNRSIIKPLFVVNTMQEATAKLQRLQAVSKERTGEVNPLYHKVVFKEIGELQTW